MAKTEVEKLLDEKIASFKRDAIVKGTISEMTDKEVIIDFGYKTEGFIPKTEFKKDTDVISPGMEVFAIVESLELSSNGFVPLSKEKADTLSNWENIEKIFEKNLTVEGVILSRIKGGFEADIGMKAFLPGSQLDNKPIIDYDQYLGMKSCFKVIKIDRKRKNVVLSRKKFLEEAREENKKVYFNQIQKGSIVKGKVRNVTDYGVFIEIDNGIVGLLHINDMSWGRVNHPSEMFSIDNEIEIVILDINLEKQLVAFGYKQRFPNPWEEIEIKYPVDSIIEGKVVNITDYGAFIQLENGIEGLLHISELSWTNKVKHPSEIVTMGDILKLKVIDINKSAQKISFSLKQLESNPWPQIAEKFPVGSIVKGKVYHIIDLGAFIEIEKGIDGFLHISNISEKQINHPSEILRKGQKINVMVLDIDQDNKKISLGIKQLGDIPLSVEEDLE